MTEQKDSLKFINRNMHYDELFFIEEVGHNDFIDKVIELDVQVVCKAAMENKIYEIQH